MGRGDAPTPPSPAPVGFWPASPKGGDEDGVPQDGIVPLASIFRALPTLETERLVLRALAAEDAGAIFAYSWDPEVARYTGWEPARSIEDAQAFIDSVLRRYQAGQPAGWGVVHRADQRLIGTCGFTAYSPVSGSGFLAYALAREYWGKGLTTEAALKVIDFGFTVIGLHRVQATCLAENVASWRVMEKAGMRYEGVLKEFAFKEGKRWDVKVYSVLRSEWAG